MAKHTLYDAERFLVFLLTFYGFNESNAILKVFYNRIIRFIAFPLVSIGVVIIMGYVYTFEKSIEEATIKDKLRTVWLYLKLFYGANLVCIFLCHFRKRNFNALLKVLKRYEVSPKLSRKIRNWNIFLAFFACPIYVIWLSWSNLEFKSMSEIAFNFGLGSLTQLLFHCLPFCSLPVLVSVHYINHTLNEGVEEIKKCESPWRRARLTTRLTLLSTRFSPLVKATNDYGAPLMFLLKASATILSVILIYTVLTNITETKIEGLAKNVPPLLIFLIYLWYLRVAPSANQIPSLMARVMVENVMRDERGMSREPISRIQLLKTRSVHLAHLTHSNFNQERFTVLGEPVDETDIFMVFVDIIDNYNSYISGIF